MGLVSERDAINLYRSGDIEGTLAAGDAGAQFLSFNSQIMNSLHTFLS